MKMKKSSGLNAAMKKVGRNMARANLQKASPKVPGYADGGGVRMPMAKDMGTMSGGGMERTGFGAGRARGGGAATKGKKFLGAC